jgi:hypothetical protein
MNTSLKAPMALGFILAIPLFALPAHGALAYDTGNKAAHDRIADFANAQAYVSPVTPVEQAAERNGLGRNDNECNMGCIDH